MLPSAWPCMLHLIIWTFFKISSGWRMTTNGSQVQKHESAGRPIGGQRLTALKISTISMWRSYTKWIPLHMGLSYTQPEAVNRNVVSAWLIFRKKSYARRLHIINLTRRSLAVVYELTASVKIEWDKNQSYNNKVEYLLHGLSSTQEQTALKSPLYSIHIWRGSNDSVDIIMIKSLPQSSWDPPANKPNSELW